MDKKKTILIVDDEDSNRQSLAAIVSKEGYRVLTASEAKEARNILAQEKVELVLTDLRMPEMDGLAFLKLIKKEYSQLEVILLTAYGTVEIAVEAMKEGAYDFITKPIKRLPLIRAIDKALEKQQLATENRQLKKRLAKLSKSKQLIGNSKIFRQTVSTIEQVAPSQATIMIEGESGTGKELVAEAIHNLSSRADEQFVKLSCASLPETLLEAELFGYEKGAFTGAHQRKAGRFEMANKGTLFLDEITEIPAAVQVKLLRVLQQGEFERLGSNQTHKADVRIVAATNRDLLKVVKEGSFREDLYYRLNVIKIHLPNLRQRQGDISLLASFFLQKYAALNQKKITKISEQALTALENYSWPGNVRELENAIERAVVLCRQQEIGLDDLAEEICSGKSINNFLTIPAGTPLAEIEKKMIERTLQQTKGDKNKTAEILGIHPRTIYRKLDK